MESYKTFSNFGSAMAFYKRQLANGRSASFKKAGSRCYYVHVY